MTLYLQVEISQRRYLIDCEIVKRVLSARALFHKNQSSSGHTELLVYEGYAHQVVDLRREMFGEASKLFISSRLLILQDNSFKENVFLVEKVIDLYRKLDGHVNAQDSSRVIIDGLVYQILTLADMTQGIQQGHYHA